jgi:hypothetical protein
VESQQVVRIEGRSADGRRQTKTSMRTSMRTMPAVHRRLRIAIDEVGYVPMAEAGVEFLFQLIADRLSRQRQAQAEIGRQLQNV